MSSGLVPVIDECLHKRLFKLKNPQGVPLKQTVHASRFKRYYNDCDSDSPPSPKQQRQAQDDNCILSSLSELEEFLTFCCISVTMKMMIIVMVDPPLTPSPPT